MSQTPMGLVLVHKPPGITSFKVLHYYKRFFGTKKIGHTGTLDRFAEGLMLVLVGQATRLAAWITLADKEYIADIRFGLTTDTLDPEGRPAGEGRVPTQAELAAVLPRFIGELDQVPPSFSAIHVDGRRAYERALDGEELNLSPRRITIAELELLAWEGDTARLRVRCTKGTYIRSLARDIAAALGAVAYVVTLVRTAVGPFGLTGAHEPEGAITPVLLTGSALLPALPRFAVLQVTTDQARLLGQGAKFNGTWLSLPTTDLSSPLACLDETDRLVAVLEFQDGAWRYSAVFN